MKNSNNIVKVYILGTSQDGGFPHTGCLDTCCKDAWENLNLKRLISSIAIIIDKKVWIIDITPDFSLQLHKLQSEISQDIKLEGIFITHAHIGHYTGLLELGLESMHTNRVPVYVMPKMKQFIKNNNPFTQLIELQNIILEDLSNKVPVKLNDSTHVIPFLVPHRNEFSETVGYKIKSDNISLVYIPDIDSWEKWDIDINELIKSNDILLLDGTFYSSNELRTRNIKDVPHPFIKDSINKFSSLDIVYRNKVYFTHFNHTNPAIKSFSREKMYIKENGFGIAKDGMMFTL